MFPGSRRQLVCHGSLKEDAEELEERFEFESRVQLGAQHTAMGGYSLKEASEILPPYLEQSQI
jgi:hypothetical protein